MFSQLKHARQTQETLMMSERKQEEIAKEKLEKVNEKIDESQDVEDVSHEEETVHQEAKTISVEDSHEVETPEKKTCAEVVETDVAKAQKPLDENQQDKNVDKESALEVKAGSEVKAEMDSVVLKVEEIKLTDQNLGTEKETKEPVAKDEGETRDEELKTDDSIQNAETAVVSVPGENLESDSKDKLTERTLPEETEENDNAAGDVGLPDAHRIEEGKPVSTHMQEHMGEEESREPVSEELLESLNRDKRPSSETDDSSDAYTDVLVEGDDEEEAEEEEEERLPEMTADVGKAEALNANYVQLNEESPMELDGKMRRHIQHGSEEDLESKQQDSLNVEDNAQMGMPVYVYELFRFHASLIF